METNSLAALFDPRLMRPMRPDTLSGLRAQGLCLVQYAFHLSRTSLHHVFSLLPPADRHSSDTNASAQEILMMDSAIRAHMNILPGIRNGGEMGELMATPGLSPVNHRIVFIRTLPLVASLILFQHGGDATARQRVGQATQGIVAIVNELGDADYTKLFIGLGVCGSLRYSRPYADSSVVLAHVVSGLRNPHPHLPCFARSYSRSDVPRSQYGYARAQEAEPRKPLTR